MKSDIQAKSQNEQDVYNTNREKKFIDIFISLF